MGINQDTTPVVYRELAKLPGIRFGSDGTIQSRRIRGRWEQMLGDWRTIKPTITAEGYSDIRLVALDGRRRTYQLHRLILEAFIGPCPDGMECRHLDGNPRNNAVTNLAWGTSRENKADRERLGRTARGSRNGRAKLNEARVRSIRRIARMGGMPSDIARVADVKLRTITLILERRKWSHVDDEEPTHAEAVS